MKSKLTYSPDELRAALGIGRGTVYDLLRSGQLRSVRVGRRIIVPSAEVDRFLLGAGEPKQGVDKVEAS